MNYSSILAALIKGTILFVQNAWGSIQHPYETYRKLSEGKNLVQAVPIFLLCLIYFGWTTLIHVGLRGHPLLISFNFFKITVAAVVTFGVVTLALVGVGRAFGGRGTVKSVVLPWTYALLPTLVWFFMTSLLWLLFPPPRTLEVSGKALSFTFLVFSWFLFFWKGVLYYLTLRFGMRLTFLRILGVSLIIFPLGFLYSILMYRLGVFRVPFL